MHEQNLNAELPRNQSFFLYSSEFRQSTIFEVYLSKDLGQLVVQNVRYLNNFRVSGVLIQKLPVDHVAPEAGTVSEVSRFALTSQRVSAGRSKATCLATLPSSSQEG